MSEPYLSHGSTLRRWAPEGSVRTFNYSRGVDVSASITLNDTSTLVFHDSAQLRQLAAVARRLAFQMELAEETGQQPAADEVAA